jgi:hypothetical protein
MMFMKETKVIKIKLVTYNRILKLGKPFKFGESNDDVINRILDKIEKPSKPSKKK